MALQNTPKPLDPNEAIKNSQIDSSWIGTGAATPTPTPTPTPTSTFGGAIDKLKN